MAFRTHEYRHDRKAESYGLEAAEKLGLDRGCVFRTLAVEWTGSSASRFRWRRSSI